VLSLVPILVISHLSLLGFRSVLYQSITNNLSQTTVDKAARISQWLHERASDARGMSEAEAVRDAVGSEAARPEAERFLKVIKRTYGYYSEVCIANLSGERLVSTEGKALAGRVCPGFSYALSGDVTISDVQIMPPDTEPEMFLAAPIRQGAGSNQRPDGVLMARIDLLQLDSIASDIHIGKTAEAYLVNASGYFLTDTRFRHGVRLREKVNTQGFQDCLKNRQGVGIYRDYRNEMVLGSYLYLPDRNWCLLVEQDRDEALQPMRDIQRRVVLFTLLAMVVVLGFVVATSTLIVDRIRRGDAQLEQQRKELTRAEKLASTGRMAAGIAHEINNPINSIMNCATLMQGKIRKGEFDPEYFNRFLSSIEKECRRTARTIRDFLDFSRETGPKFALTGINPVVEETMVLLEPEAVQRRVEVRRELADRLPEVNADRDQLKQAFRNIVLNAYEAMPGGGRLIIRTLRQGGWVVTEFADTGAGISSENLNRIFDPFFTTKSGGSGLGLSVVYGIIDRHNGKIEIESEPGRGTRFVIKLPRAKSRSSG
jgi:two-component system NtrC family sensor kinase